MMDRRSFVVGTTALWRPAPLFAQDAFPSHAITIVNAFPPGGHQRYRDAAAREHVGAHPEAAGRRRDQSRRRRPSRCAGRRQRQAGRIHAALAQHRHFRLCGGRQAVRTSGEDVACRFHPAGADRRRPGSSSGQRSAALQNRRRNSSTTSKSGRTPWCSVRADSMARPICR